MNVPGRKKTGGVEIDTELHLLPSETAIATSSALGFSFVRRCTPATTTESESDDRHAAVKWTTRFRSEHARIGIGDWFYF